MADKLKFILFIVVTATIGQMAAEVYIPSLPYISENFHVSHSLVQLSIAVFLFGMALPGIFFGYISDYFGRRRILLLTTSIGCCGTVVCLIAPNIYVLILGRFIQGLGFSGVGSLSRAILRDKFSGIELIRYSSNLAIVLALVIDLSPFIGGFLQQHWGWRSIFGLLLAYNLLAVYLSYRFKNSPQTELNPQLNLSKILHVSARAFRSRDFVRYNLISAVTYAIFMTYFAVASFLFQDVLGLSPQRFGLTILCLSSLYMLGAFVNGRLLRRFKVEVLIRNGVILMWLAGGLLLLLATVVELSLLRLVVVVGIIYFASSCLFANSSGLAFSGIRKNIGSASAVYSTLQVIVGALATGLISFFDPSSTLPLAMIILLLCCGLSYLISAKHFKNPAVK